MPGPTDEFCTACGARIPSRGTYCPNCGAVKPSLVGLVPPRSMVYYQQGPFGTYPVVLTQHRIPSQWRRVIKSITAFGMLSYLAFLALTLNVLLYGIGIVLPEIVNHSFVLYVVFPILIDVWELSGDVLGVYYLLLVTAILISVAWVLITSARRFLGELLMKAKSRDHSALFDVCALLFAVLFLNFVIVLILELAGADLGDPTEESDLWELLFLLANASVYEELVVRVLLLGVPLLIVDVARKSVRQKLHAYILGGGFAFGIPEIVLVLISSTIFGLAHFDAWGAWKIFPSAVAGVAFAYLFMKHGLAAAIMLHFGFDYMSMPATVYDSLAMTVLTGLGVMIWIALGAAFFIYFMTRMYEFITGKLVLEERPAIVGAPAFQPMWPTFQQYGWQAPEVPSAANKTPPQVWQGPVISSGSGLGPSYVCPVCAYTEARWVNGQWQCLRCGHLS